MNLTGQFLIRVIIIVKLNYVIGKSQKKEQIATLDQPDPEDWRLVETLAEEHPYVAGLLNSARDYMCTGIIIDKRTVLTSGRCLEPTLRYIAIGSAVLSKKLNSKNLYEIAGMKLHTDYIFALQSPDPNVTQMHSNIGLVFSVKPALEAYIPAADFGNYFAPELQQKNLKVVGFGKINETNLAVLQHQLYHQAPCTNPKWYYCICGIEFSGYVKTYIHQFGEGAPVFLDSEVVGITAAPCGILALKNMNVPYNIFTILGPYLTWIEKRKYLTSERFRATSDAEKQTYLNTFCFFLIVIRVLLY